MAGKLTLVAAFAATLICASNARAVEVGLADQHALTFAEPGYRALGLGYARIVVPWDVATTDPGSLDPWLAAARAAGARPLVSFGVDGRQRCPARPCTPPTAEEYAAAIPAFHARLPQAIDLGL